MSTAWGKNAQIDLSKLTTGLPKGTYQRQAADCTAVPPFVVI
jgi:hypothetical protein